MGRIAILGATGSIGRAVAARLDRQGRALTLVGRDFEKLAQLGHELGQPMVPFDFQSSDGLADGLRTADETGEGYDGIVNCIGSLLLKPAHLTSDDEFRQTVETNLFTAFATVRAAGQLLRERGGTVVLFASAAAAVGLANHEAIAAAKAGIIGLARSAAATYATSNVRFNVVSPGLVRTELTRRIWEQPTMCEASKAMHALGRLGEPEQIASLVCWLLDPENDWVTGQVFGVDGGLAHVRSRK